MDKKTQEVIDALNTIGLGYGRAIKDTKVQATRDALRVLAGHVVDALTERKGSMGQSASLQAIRCYASTAREYRRNDEFKRIEEKADAAIARGEL